MLVGGGWGDDGRRTGRERREMKGGDALVKEGNRRGEGGREGEAKRKKRIC